MNAGLQTWREIEKAMVRGEAVGRLWAAQDHWTGLRRLKKQVLAILTC
jgi:hypothetical protein